MRTLVLGGIRSGKSQWAELAIAEAVGPGEPVRYLATGSDAGTDSPWSQRVAAHRAGRPQHWPTVETWDVAGELRAVTGTATLIDLTSTTIGDTIDIALLFLGKYPGL